MKKSSCRPRPTAERLREIAHYEPETGIFTALVSRGNLKKGAQIGCVNKEGYRQISVDDVKYLASNLAWLYVYGTWPAQWIDHRDRDKLNDRIGNLREATPSQNQANKAALRRNTSGAKGVSRSQQAPGWAVRWHATIQVRRKPIFIGSFKTLEEAAAAYRQATEHYNGEFACTDMVN